MFAYVDKEIRRMLENDDRLVTVDENGNPAKAANAEGKCVSILGPIPIPRMVRDKEVVFSWYAFVRRVELKNVMNAANQVEHGEGDAFRELVESSMSVNSVLASPGFFQAEQPLVRLHSCCLTGEVFGSMRCECGPQLDASFERICEEGGGAVVYMSSHEGRGIGLWAKAVTYLLQDDGQDTYQANASLGLPEDSRDFSDAAIVLRYLLKGKPIRLLSNNPLKQEQLERSGQPVSELIPHVAGVGSHNRRYMRAKKSKGHLLPDM